MDADGKGIVEFDDLAFSITQLLLGPCYVFTGRDPSIIPATRCVWR